MRSLNVERERNLPTARPTADNGGGIVAGHVGGAEQKRRPTHLVIRKYTYAILIEYV